MRTLPVVLLLVAIPAAAAAQRARPKPRPAPAAAPAALPLTDVVATAVRVSPELELAKIDLEAARGAAMVAEGAEDFRLTLSGDYVRERRKPTATVSVLEVNDLTGV